MRCSICRAIRIELYQETASYTKPSSIKYKETFPLPPYSTVIGMIHRLCDYKEYVDMQISIQGTYADKFKDFCTKYEYPKGLFKTSKLDKKTGKENFSIINGKINPIRDSKGNIRDSLNPRRAQVCMLSGDMNTSYGVTKGVKIRQWEQVNSIYGIRGITSIQNDESVLYDSDNGDVVFFA